MAGMDSQRQTCKACHRPDKFNFHVPDQVWTEVVPPELRRLVVCLDCFDEFARRSGVEYASALSELWFAGDQACVKLRAEWSGRGLAAS